MEQIGNTLRQIAYSTEQKMSTQNVTNHVTQYALNRDKANHVNMTCTYDTIPKKEYGLLLRKMESWGITAPKAIVKKYGVFIVKRAVEYTEHTPNVRNKAGYMTYMCGQFRKDLPQVEQKTQNPPTELTVCEEKPKEVEVITEKTNPSEKRTQCPQINSPLQANIFLCDYEEGKYAETAEIIEFVRKIKRQFNFG